MSSDRASGKLKVALLTTDNRWVWNDYDNPTPHFGPAPESLIEGLAAHPKVQLHIVSSTRRLMNAPEKLGETVWYHSQYVPKIGWMRTAYQGCVRATRKTLAAIQPDIVHGQGTESDCSVSAVFSGYPNVLTIHGNMRLIAKVEKARPFSYTWLAARLEGFVIPRARGVVCISRHTQQAVGGLARRTWLVPNAVNGSFFGVNKSPRPPGAGVPRILCVARICELKNQNAFIRSLDPLADRYKFEVVFVGKVSESEPYGAEFIELTKTRPWCRSVGWSGRDKVRELLEGAALLALTSLEENCPMVVLEAMAAGVPVVAPRVGGVPDLIREDETGVFCDPRDLTSMRAAVEKVLGNPQAAGAMAERARQYAEQHFHPAVIAQRHVEIYEEALGRAGAR